MEYSLIAFPIKKEIEAGDVLQFKGNFRHGEYDICISPNSIDVDEWYPQQVLLVSDEEIKSGDEYVYWGLMMGTDYTIEKCFGPLPKCPRAKIIASNIRISRGTKHEAECLNYLSTFRKRDLPEICKLLSEGIKTVEIKEFISSNATQGMREEDVIRTFHYETTSNNEVICIFDEEQSIKEAVEKWNRDRGIGMKRYTFNELMELVKSEDVKKYHTSDMFSWRDMKTIYIMGILNKEMSIDELSEEMPKQKEKLAQIKKWFKENKKLLNT